MSTKRQLRQERRARQEAEKAKGGGKLTVAIVVGVLVLVLAVAFAVDRWRAEDRGPPPYPGAVWSDAHGHWH